MAANEVKLTIRVQDDGGLDIVQKKSNAAAKSIDQLGQATNRTTRARNLFHKGEKGVAAAGANSTKNFSKMNQTMTGSSGLVAAYATLAANVFALTAAFGVLQRAAQLEQLKIGFETLANTVGRTSSLIVKSIQEITDGAVAGEEAFRVAAAGFNAGFSQIEIERLTRVAKNASQALGRNLTDSLDRLVRGTAKLEPEILDELGIFIRLDDAVQRYADSLGRAASDLTQAERRQAFLNEALAQGELKFAGLTDVIPANPFDKLAANFDKVSKTFLNLVGNVLNPVVSVLATSTTALVGVLLIFGKTVTSAMFPVLNKLGEKYTILSEQAAASAVKAAESQEKLVQNARKGIASESAVSKKSKFAEIQKKIQNDEKLSLEELRIGQKSLEQAERRRTSNLKKFSGENLAAKEAELEAVRRQKQAVEELIRAEKGRTGPQLQAKAAERGAASEKAIGDAIEKIQSGGIIKGFEDAKEALDAYRKDLRNLASTDFLKFEGRLKFLNGALKRLAIGFRIGGVAARLFGAALINAIPVIGQILFVIGLVITGLKALYNAVFPVSRATKQFEEIIGSLDEKMEQLQGTNEKLASRYFSVLRSQALLTAGTKGLTVAQIEQIQAEARSFAQVEAYANTLKVTAGVTNEFAGAVDALATELTSLEEPGFLKKLYDYVTNGVFEAISAAIDEIRLKLKSIKEFLTDNIIVRGFSAILNGFGEAVTTAVSNVAGPDAVSAFNTAPIISRARDFKSEVLSQFEELSESAPGVAKAITKNLGMPFEAFVDSQLAGIKTARTYEEAQQAFVAATTSVSGVLKNGAIQAQNASDAISNFGENVNRAQVSLTAMRDKFFRKGEFGQLAAEITLTQNAVKALKEATESEDGPGFAAAISRAVKAGEIDLGTYGITLEQVTKEGTEAFTPLIEKLEQADLQSRTLTDTVKTLNAEIENTKALNSLKELQYELRNIEEALRTTGKTDILVGRNLKDLEDRRKARIAAIKEEASIRRDIIKAELGLELLKLEILEATTKLTEEQIRLVEGLKDALVNTANAQTAAVDTQASTGITGVNIDFLKTGEALRNNLVGVASTGETTAERLLNLADAFGPLKEKGLEALDILDSKGNVVGNNFSGKLSLMTGALAPMVDKLKELGSEGQVVASFVEGMLVMSNAVAMLGDVIQREIEVGAVKSFSDFIAQFKKADFVNQAAVLSSAFAAAAASIGALASTLSAGSANAIQGIDKQIEQEKKLDGVSQQSTQKILTLEKKKENMKKQQFETNKKLMLAQAVMSTAAAVMGALALLPFIGPAGAIALAALVGAVGAAQIAIIAGMSYQGGALSAGSNTPSSVSLGERKSSVDTATSQSAAGELAYFRGAAGTGGPENFRPSNAFAGMKYRANGGNTGVMVGEQGPELFVPDRPGRIVPSDEVQQSSVSNINFSINAVDAAGVEEVLIKQRGNIIGMLREAANAHGQEFLEAVDVSVYAAPDRRTV